MSEDFATRMRELSSEAARVQEAASGPWTAELGGRVRRGRRVRRATIATVAAMTVAVVALGGSALAHRPAPVPVVHPSPTSPAPTSSAGPSYWPGVPVMDGWHTAGVEPALFAAAVVTDATSVGGRVVAVGCGYYQQPVPRELPVWVGDPDDASSWHRASIEPNPASGPFPVSCLRQVVSTRYGLFAAGTSLVHSDDGEAWTEVALEQVTDPDDLTVLAIAPVGDRVTVLTSHRLAEATRVASLWTTTDGTTWTRLGSGPRTVTGGDDPAATFDNADVSSVVTYDGLVVAVGASPWERAFNESFNTPWPDSVSPTATVWTSHDGTTWRQGAVEEPEGCYLADVEPTSSGLVLAGWCKDGPGLWTSEDGTSWRRAAAPTIDMSPPDLEPPAIVVGERIVRISAVSVLDDGTMLLTGSEYPPDVSYSGASNEGWISLPIAHLWRGSPATGWTELGGSLSGFEDQLVTTGDLAAPFAIVDRVGFWPRVGVHYGMTPRGMVLIRD
jgi:hypothetical protein